MCSCRSIPASSSHHWHVGKLALLHIHCYMYYALPSDCHIHHALQSRPFPIHAGYSQLNKGIAAADPSPPFAEQTCKMNATCATKCSLHGSVVIVMSTVYSTAKQGGTRACLAGGRQAGRGEAGVPVQVQQAEAGGVHNQRRRVAREGTPAESHCASHRALHLHHSRWIGRYRPRSWRPVGAWPASLLGAGDRLCAGLYTGALAMMLSVTRDVVRQCIVQLAGLVHESAL